MPFCRYVKGKRVSEIGTWKVGREPGLAYNFPILLHMVRLLGILYPAHRIWKGRGGACCFGGAIQASGCDFEVLVRVSRHVLER
jgi:hypothetical protein